MYENLFSSDIGSDSLLPVTLTLAVVGASALLISLRLLGRCRGNPARLLVLLIWSGLATLGGVLSLLWLVYKYDLAEDRCGDELLTTEGAVRVVRQQPERGHAPGDLIEVGGRQFEIDYFSSGPGYHQTIAHGGALTDGAAVRVESCSGTILRVDIKRGPAR